MRNLIVGVVCFLAIGAMTVNLAAAQKGQGKGKAQASQKKGQKGKGAQGQGNGMNASTIAARMIQRFDKNGDKALNVQELAAALQNMRDQRRSGQAGPGKGGPGKSKGKGGPGKGKGGPGKGKTGTGK